LNLEALWSRYELVQDGDGYGLLLYLDPRESEFAKELGDAVDARRARLEELVRRFVQKRFPHLKVKTARILAGTTLLGVIPLGGASVQAETTEPADAINPVRRTAAETMMQAQATAQAPFHLGYLYFGSPESQVRFVDRMQRAIQVVSPNYFNLNPDGSLKVTQLLDVAFVEEMHKRGVRVVPFMSNHFDRQAGRRALENREALSTQLAELIERYHLDGIHVDIENVTEVDRSAYTDLVRL
jgi:hypothetical protein